MLTLLSLLIGCSDYKIKVQETGTLQLNPTAVTLEGACSYEERTVTLESVGEFAVEITAIDIDGEGWVILEEPDLPASIEPGESAEVVVLGNSGEATLTVESNDPDTPTQTAQLIASDNAAPTLSWVSPTDGAVVEPGAQLVVAIEDASDAPEELVVAWESSVDGSIGVAYGDSEGQSTVDWSEASGGDHTLTATVTDTCGTTTSVDLDVCRQDGYYSDNLDLSTWELSGNANYDESNGWVELTDVASTFQLGSAFQTKATTGDNVQLSFSFYVSGGTGADGFAVTALDTSRATAYVAQSGGCLGYGGGGVCGEYDPLYGWNVEVDTYFSAGLDPTEADHVSFHFDGDVANFEAYAELPEMEDGSWHDMTIQILAPRVTIAIDGVTYIDEDIEGHYDFPAEVGFTAATGGETNYHLINALSVIEKVCQ